MGEKFPVFAIAVAKVVVQYNVTVIGNSFEITEYLKLLI